MQRPRPMLAFMESSLKLLERMHRAHWQALSPAERIGQRGERAAYFHLRRQGYTVVARRWRYVHLDGEVDLIAWEGETLCFIEVKTRSQRTPFAAEFAVGDKKQALLKRMAEAYVRQLPWRGDAERTVETRFDVVSVYHDAEGRNDVRLLRDYFR